jgi:hypothetical protein
MGHPRAERGPLSEESARSDTHTTITAADTATTITYRYY